MPSRKQNKHSMWTIEQGGRGGNKGRETEKGRERKMDFLSTNLHTKEIPPWATGKTVTEATAAWWRAFPGGLSQVIISKLLLSCPWAEAQPSTHTDAQTLVFLPEEMERAALHTRRGTPSLGSQSTAWALHPQGSLGTSVRGQRHISSGNVTGPKFSK